MKQKFCISLLISIALVLSSVSATTQAKELEKNVITEEVPALQESEENGTYSNQAEVLKDLGLFNGTENGFELDRIPTRAEGAVMLVRLLGAEEEALTNSYKHPFTDVPAWADSYVAYLFANQLTTGISDKLFGSTESLNANQYVTFILRSLGYDDKSGDFKWDEATEKAKELDIVTADEANKLEHSSFLRDHVVLISYNALQTPMKSGIQLSKHLINNGVITEDKAKEAGLVAAQYIPQKEFNGLSILQTHSSTIDIIIDKTKLDPSLRNYKTVGVLTYSKLDDFEATLSKVVIEAVYSNEEIDEKQKHDKKLEHDKKHEHDKKDDRHKHRSLKDAMNKSKHYRADEGVLTLYQHTLDNQTTLADTYYSIIMLFNKAGEPLAYTTILSKPSEAISLFSNIEDKLIASPSQKVKMTEQTIKNGEYHIDINSSILMPNQVYYYTMALTNEHFDFSNGIARKDLETYFTIFEPLTGNNINWTTNETEGVVTILVFDSSLAFVGYTDVQLQDFVDDAKSDNKKKRDQNKSKGKR